MSLIRAVQTEHAFLVRAICIVSMLGWVIVDRAGKPLDRGWTWMYSPPDSLPETLTGKQLRSLEEEAGRRIVSELGAMRVRELGGGAGTVMLLSLKDYIKFRLCGSISTDPIHAAYTGVYDVHERHWSSRIAETLSVDQEVLPPIEETTAISGTTDPGINEALGFGEPVDVVNGGPDGSVAVLGAGGIGPGTAVDVSGTTDVVFACSNTPSLHPEMALVTNPHPLEGLWLIGGPTGVTGGAIQKIVECIGAGSERPSFARLEQEAAQLSPGSEGLCCITSLSGDRAPHWYSEMRGTLAGLHSSHQRGHVYRAAQEGAAYAVRTLIDEIRVAGVAAEELVFIGGGARSRIGMTIRANVAGLPVRTLEHMEASSFGGAFLCALSTGIEAPETLATRIRKQLLFVDPDPHDAFVYNREYARWKALREAMKQFYGDQTMAEDIHENKRRQDT